ncbi:hypothetical protein ACFLYQ_02325 [Chloroflexota bacterium]
MKERNNIKSINTEAVSLEVLNPRGEVDHPPTVPPNPRITSLDGKKVALYWNSKENGYVFWDAIEVELKKACPSATILRYNGAFDIGDAIAERIKADGVDAFMYGMGD